MPTLASPGRLMGVRGRPQIVLTQKGYGYEPTAGAAGDSPYDLALDYNNVVGGEAPEAGDLVMWFTWALSTANPTNDLAASGWASDTVTLAGTTSRHVGAFAKVIEADDLSSPPEAITDSSADAAGFWAAFSVPSGEDTTAVFGLAGNYGGGSAPSDVGVDASGATGLLLIVALATGTDGAIQLAWAGATEDVSFEVDNLDTGNFVNVDFRAAFKAYPLDAAGDSVTLSKGDDDSENSLAGFYVTVS
jgi:hypothetical protein